MKKLYLFGVTFLSIGILSGCSNNDSAKINKLESTISSLKKENEELKSTANGSVLTETSESLKKSKTYAPGEEAIIKDSSGKEMYGLKILKATTNLSQADNAYTDGKPDNTIEVTYEYRNINYETPLIISSQFLAAYDSKGKAGKNMNMMDGQTEVSPGRSSQSTVWFVMDSPMKNESETEIEYLNDFSLGFEGVAKFKVSLEH